MLGLLVGAVVAIAKVMQRREAEVPASTSRIPTWPPPAPAPAPMATPTIESPELEHAEAVTGVPTPVDPAPAPPPVEPVAKKQGTKKAAPAKKATAARKAAPLAPWVDPVEGVCPTTHPIKAKLTSKLFHLPGMFAYERTRPDRCYRDDAAAEADGLTRAKR